MSRIARSSPSSKSTDTFASGFGNRVFALRIVPTSDCDPRQAPATTGASPLPSSCLPRGGRATLDVSFLLRDDNHHFGCSRDYHGRQQDRDDRFVYDRPTSCGAMSFVTSHAKPPIKLMRGIMIAKAMNSTTPPIRTNDNGRAIVSQARMR